ncbi:divalent metal cation transporter, partial [Oenococcus oeni]
ALLTEFVGVAGVGELFGISKWITIPIATIILVGIAFSGSYRRVEKVGIIVGLAELAFVVAMVMVHPQMNELLSGLTSIPLGEPSYIYLVAANVGAVIIPWMIFYQQGAVVDKGLSKKTIKKERHDTAVGTLITQGIMIVVVVTFAATIGRLGKHPSLNTVGEIVHALVPFIGSWQAKTLIGAS